MNDIYIYIHVKVGTTPGEGPAAHQERDNILDNERPAAHQERDNIPDNEMAGVGDGTFGEEGMPREGEGDRQHSSIANLVTRRLGSKTPWQETGYGPPQQELVTKMVAHGLKRKATIATSIQKRMNIAASHDAWNVTHSNIEAVNELIDRHGYRQEEVTYEAATTPHLSHRALQVGQTDAIYSTRCAAYSARSSLKKLGTTCEGSVPPSSARNHRLLQIGSIPAKGV